MPRHSIWIVCVTAGILAACFPLPAGADHSIEDRQTLIDQSRGLSLGTSSWSITRRFLEAVPELPIITPRTVYYDKLNRRALTEEEAAEMTPAGLEGYEKLVLDEHFYYFTRYGSPLAFSRPLSIVSEAGFTTIERARVLDFGFGSIGQLRLLASLGADVTGVEVDPLLRALYSRPKDAGTIPKSELAGALHDGTLHLVFGSFPGDSAVAAAVGADYDVIISKNTLKRGYIHPDREADPRQLIDLGVNDTLFVAAIFERLKPGGLFLIYNLHPALSRADEPYKPWADGRCPFDRSLLESAGFNVLAYDRDDTGSGRIMGRSLGWDNDMVMERDLFVTYTLVIKELKR